VLLIDIATPDGSGLSHNYGYSQSDYRTRNELLNHGTRIGFSDLYLDIGWQKGIGALDAQNNQHPKGSEPVARYKKIQLNRQLSTTFKPYKQNFSFDSLIYYQKSEDALFPPQAYQPEWYQFSARF